MAALGQRSSILKSLGSKHDHDNETNVKKRHCVENIQVMGGDLKLF